MQFMLYEFTRNLLVPVYCKQWTYPLPYAPNDSLTHTQYA